MIGDAVAIRFSRRIQRKGILLAVKVSVKKKTRRSAVKKRTSGANSSLLKAIEKTKVGRKSKLEKDPKQTSDLNSLLKVAEKKVRKKSKSEKNSKQIPKISKQASHNLKPAAPKRSRKGVSKIFDQKRETRNSLNASQVNLTDNEKQENLELELCDERKKIIKKKTPTVFTGNKKPSVRRSLRVSKSSRFAEEKRINKELNVSKVRSSRVKKPSGKKCALQVSSISSISVLTPGTGKSTRTSRQSERKRSAKSLNLEIPLHTPTSKSLPVTPHPEKVTHTTRHSENRKSARSSKGPNQSRILNSGISLNASAFQYNLETPHPEKHSEKRKSLRLLEPSPLRTLNKELSLSTPASVETQDSMINSSSKLSKSAELPAAESRGGKRGRRKVSNKEITTDSGEMVKPSRRRQVDQQKKASENFKMPLSKGTENLPLDVLTTPDFTSIHVRSISKKCLSKSDSKSSKRKFHDSATENHVTSEEVQKRKKSADFPNMRVKGTLKHKRWLLNNLKETNAGYEDDIFENQNLGLYKTAFHFGDESDGSSVNIATPKFECILTPTLPKKTPRFKDCISPTELLQARKTAEEYLYRRNKKRKSGDRASSSGKKTSMNKNNTTQGIPEKKKLDFEEAVNKLIAVQKKKDKDAEIDDEEEDSYFSDASD